MRDAGRSRVQTSERRRRDGTEYGRVLESSSQSGRRKSAAIAFAEYAEAMLRTLSVRAVELIRCSTMATETVSRSRPSSWI